MYFIQNLFQLVLHLRDALPNTVNFQLEPFHVHYPRTVAFLKGCQSHYQHVLICALTLTLECPSKCIFSDADLNQERKPYLYLLGAGRGGISVSICILMMVLTSERPRKHFL